MDAINNLVNAVIKDLLERDGQTTPQIVSAEVITRYPAEIAAYADKLVSDALTRRAHECLRQSVQRITSPQLALRLPGYELPKAIAVETIDGFQWRSVKASIAADWEAWFEARDAQIDADTLKVNEDRVFFRFAQNYGFQGDVPLEAALARAGIVL